MLDAALHPAGNGNVLAADPHRAGTHEIAELSAGELGLVALPANINIHQGDDMGRPSRLTVDIRADRLEISVTGRAVRIPA